MWRSFSQKNQNLSQFIIFFFLSNGITVLQMILMPLFKEALGRTSLVDISFLIGPIGTSFDGSIYYVFDYAKGKLSSGGGGGLAYFLAVQLTIAIAQIINFFAQRRITFKSNSNIAKAAFWYLIAYSIITIGAAAAQGLYKAPIYNLFITRWNMNEFGEICADFITMIINSAISFWVFFPIMKIIFKNEEKKVIK